MRWLGRDPHPTWEPVHGADPPALRAAAFELAVAFTSRNLSRRQFEARREAIRGAYITAGDTDPNRRVVVADLLGHPDLAPATRTAAAHAAALTARVQVLSAALMQGGDAQTAADATLALVREWRRSCVGSASPADQAVFNRTVLDIVVYPEDLPPLAAGERPIPGLDDLVGSGGGPVYDAGADDDRPDWAELQARQTAEREAARQGAEDRHAADQARRDRGAAITRTLHEREADSRRLRGELAAGERELADAEHDLRAAYGMDMLTRSQHRDDLTQRAEKARNRVDGLRAAVRNVNDDIDRLRRERQTFD